jgi:PAS domain S-box-containing protein
MRLYGNDIDDTTTVLEADLEWIVGWNKPEFLGKDALLEQKSHGVPRRLVGFEMVDRAIARHGHDVCDARWVREMRRGRSIAAPIDDLPDGERDELRAQDILSIASFPVVVDGEWWGLIGFDDCEQAREWEAPELDALHTAATILGAAIQRRRADERAAESERRYRETIEKIREVIFHTDAQGLWTYLNPAWTEITGYSVEESLGQLFLDYVHPDDRARNMELFEPLIQRKKDYCRHIIRYVTKDGESRWIEVHARLTFDDAGETNGTTGTLRDMTVQHEAETA